MPHLTTYLSIVPCTCKRPPPTQFWVKMVQIQGTLQYCYLLAFWLWLSSSSSRSPAQYIWQCRKITDSTVPVSLSVPFPLHRIRHPQEISLEIPVFNILVVYHYFKLAEQQKFDKRHVKLEKFSTRTFAFSSRRPCTHVHTFVIG